MYCLAPETYSVLDYICHEIFPLARVVRFEDLVHRIWKVPKEIFEFMSLDLQDITRDYLLKVTKTGNGSDLKSITNRWKTKMEFTEIANIQRDCKDAMLMWGYTIYKHSQEMETKESFGELLI